MKRALFGLGCLSLGFLAQSCVDDRSAVYVSAVLTPDDECMIEADAPILTFGTYDPRSRAPFVLSLRIESQLVSRQTSIAADPSSVIIDEADVSLLAVDGSPLNIGAPNPFRVPVSGFIPSSDDGTPSTSFLQVVAVPPAIASAVEGAPGGSFVISVQLRGETTGGLDIVTAPFSYAVYLANLCDETRDVHPCHPAQDGGNWCSP